MLISPMGVALIKRFESLKLDPYLDAKGNWTVGWGHLLRRTDIGKAWTQEQADAQLAQDVSVACTGIPQHVSQPQYDAMASLAFNIGSGNFLSSTVHKCADLGHWQPAADAFLLWSDHGLLIERRKLERAIFLYGSPA